jgi:hypothetical protein
LNDLKQLELLFFEILEDLKDYLDDLTLVGGWLPYVYSRFLWDNLSVQTVATVDIDFGFSGNKTKVYPKTIFELLSSLDYTERHLQMDRMYPVVLYKQGKIPIDFITPEKTDDKLLNKFFGRQININRIDKFDFLIKSRIPLEAKIRKKSDSYKIHCPKPSAFLYHKGATFIDREDRLKQAKDLHYMYFILRYVPDLDVILTEVAQYKKQAYFINISKNIKKYFEKKTSQGCLMIEKENGPDEYIDDLRQDIFERFNKLLEVL